MVDALIIDAGRTPRGIGKAGKGALAGIHPQQLGATVLKAIAERNGINTAEVDDIIWGTSAQRGPQGGDLGRMSALDAGYDIARQRHDARPVLRLAASPAVNFAAAHDHGGHGGPGHRRRHRDDVDAARPPQAPGRAAA